MVNKRQTTFSRSVIFSLAVAIPTVLLGCGGGEGDSEQAASACGEIGLGTKIINGQSCDDIANATVVRIGSVLDVNGQRVLLPMCSGTMIDSNTVLTAAHCISSEFAGFRVLNQGVLVGEPGRSRFVEGLGFSIAPDYRYDPATARLFNDAAIIRLVEPAQLPTTPILDSREAVVGEDGYVYGYGIREENDKEAESADFFSLEAGVMTINEVTSNHLFGLFSGGGVNVCNGDSGGPLMVKTEFGLAIAGVVSQGSVEGCVEGDITTYTNLQQPDVRRWLASIASPSTRSLDPQGVTNQLSNNSGSSDELNRW